MDQPLPTDALACRQRAEQALTEDGGDPMHAIGWALLGICAELAAQRRDARKGR